MAEKRISELGSQTNPTGYSFIIDKGGEDSSKQISYNSLKNQIANEINVSSQINNTVTNGYMAGKITQSGTGSSSSQIVVKDGSALKTIPASSLPGGQGVGQATDDGGEIFNYYEGDGPGAPNVAGYKSHAEGVSTIALGGSAHAEGSSTRAAGNFSHAGGYLARAETTYSFAHGNDCEATSFSSVAFGEGTYTPAETGSMAIGRYNALPAPNIMFVIGNGNKIGTAITQHNCFRVDSNGEVHAAGSYNSSGADYAEYFEWNDQNPNKEDRIGYFVSLVNGNKIEKANSESEVLGIISGTAGFVGDSYEDSWTDRFLRDEFGRFVQEEITIPDEYMTVTKHRVNEETGEIEEYEEEVLVQEEHTVITFKTNPNYDPEREYKPRSERSEWDIVGLLGKLFVRDDGTCEVGGKCKPNENGIATASEEGYHVLERTGDNIIRILLK